MLIAQAMVEYGVMASLAGAMRSAVAWAQASLTYDRPVWIAAGLAAILIWFLFGRR
jgi:hypothetical protein